MIKFTFNSFLQTKAASNHPFPFIKSKSTKRAILPVVFAVRKLACELTEFEILQNSDCPFRFLSFWQLIKLKLFKCLRKDDTLGVCFQYFSGEMK